MLLLNTAGCVHLFLLPNVHEDCLVQFQILLLGFWLGLHGDNQVTWEALTSWQSLSSHQPHTSLPLTQVCSDVSYRVKGTGHERQEQGVGSGHSPGLVWRVWPRAGVGQGLILLNHYSKTNEPCQKEMSWENFLQASSSSSSCNKESTQMWQATGVMLPRSGGPGLVSPN